MKYALIGWLFGVPLHIEHRAPEQCTVTLDLYRAAGGLAACYAVRPNEQYTLPSEAWYRSQGLKPE